MPIVFTVTFTELLLMYQLVFEVIECLNWFNPCSNLTALHLLIWTGVNKGGKREIAQYYEMAQVEKDQIKIDHWEHWMLVNEEMGFCQRWSNRRVKKPRKNPRSSLKEGFGKVFQKRKFRSELRECGLFFSLRFSIFGNFCLPPQLE